MFTISTYLVVVTPLKNISQNLAHLPQFSGWKYKIFELPPPRYDFNPKKEGFLGLFV